MAKGNGSARDALRAITVGGPKNFKRKTVEWKGHEFEIRQPSLKQRAVIRKRSQQASGDIDIFDMLCWAVIHQVYVPGTDERVFDETDYEELMSHPPGGFMDVFGGEVSEIMTVDMDELAKNFARTERDSSSSSSRKKSAAQSTS